MTEASNYLLELRKRILLSLLVTILVFFILCWYANPIYHLLAMPLLRQLPVGQGLIATNITSTFFVPFKFVFIVSLLLAAPYFLYHLWCFISPALYTREKKMIWVLLMPSIILFYLGILFTYTLILPLIFNFFVHTTPANVELRPDIGQYLEFTLQLFFVFGLAFQVPVLVLVLLYCNMVSLQQLRDIRPYVIVADFVVGMILTPDVVSQILLAISLWMLYELGLLLGRFLKS
jgi:sec-independent protein translocase protein TatC